MIEKLKETFAALKESAASVQSLYRERYREYVRLNEEIQRTNEAPPSRAYLERLLINAVDRFCDRSGEKLRECVQLFERHAHEGEDDLATRLADGFINYPNDYGLAALWREGLHAGAKHFAANCPWPEGIDSTIRAQRLHELEPKRQALAEEIATLQDEAAKAGIKL